MENNKCTLNDHKYSLWQIENETQVSRICDKCQYKEILRMTPESLNQIKIQEKAKAKVNKFLNLPNDDNNIIGFAYAIIDKFINYIDNNLKTLLINKLNEIRLRPETTEINNTLLETIIKAIAENDGELLDNTIKEFEYHNMEDIQNPIIETKQSFSK